LHPTTFIGDIVTDPTIFTPQGWLGLVLDMSLIEIRYGGNIAQVTALPDAGAGPRRLVEAVAGLVVGNPKGVGKFTFTAA
jgi:microcystin-dependent protein